MAWTKEELTKTGEIDHELKEFLEKANLPKPDFSDVYVVRAGAVERAKSAMASLGSPPEGVTQKEITIPLRDGSTNRGVLVAPSAPPAGGSPLVVLFHGGGFCMGAPEGEIQTARNVTQAFGATCLSAAYRLAPEHPFPVAPDDAWDALQWAAANAETLGANPKAGFVVGGTSAGGNIAASLALRARDNGLSPPLTGQYLAIPAVCGPPYMPEKYKDLQTSYQQNYHAPVLPQAAIDMFMESYKPDSANWLHTPMIHPKGHAALPPAYFQVCGMDPLRDEAVIYEMKLQEQGIKTKFDMYPGLPHGFWGFFPALSSSNKFREEQVAGLGWLLGKEPSWEKISTMAVTTAV
ncbi:MAG: hypothetical protein Q9227_008748 [Pyrenula ochraceoflavens]